MRTTIKFTDFPKGFMESINEFACSNVSFQFDGHSTITIDGKLDERFAEFFEQFPIVYTKQEDYTEEIEKMMDILETLKDEYMELHHSVPLDIYKEFPYPSQGYARMTLFIDSLHLNCGEIAFETYDGEIAYIEEIEDGMEELIEEFWHTYEYAYKNKPENNEQTD